MLNDQLFEKRWHEIKQMIVNRWARIRLNDIEGVRGDLERLVGHIQTAYGCARARAEMEYHEFRTTIRPLLQPQAVAPAARIANRLAR